MFATSRPQSDKRLLERLDPAYWHPGYDRVLEDCGAPLARLGDFIEDITYGPIVTGPPPPPCNDGLPVIHQGQVADTGVDTREATRVAPGSPWDRERARVREGDIVLPRSGVASVAKNRVALFLGDYTAVVGSFVDLIRLRDIDATYVLVCMKSEIVWSQIHRAINGVGTPNISFDEVRALRIPVLPKATQLDFRAQYLDNVHSSHMAWIRGDESARQAGVAALKALVEALETCVAKQTL